MRISSFRALIRQLRPQIEVKLRKFSALPHDDDLSLAPLPPPQSVLAPTNEDLSFIDVNVRPVFNFAYFVNKSETLQTLIKLNVNLHNIEKHRSKMVEPILKLDNKELQKYLIFLNDYVEPEALGKYLTTNPAILKEDLGHLQTRINYLQSKKFDKDMIKAVVSKNPLWLTHSTFEIDKRLGYFQKQFDLHGNEVRMVAVKQPNLITHDLREVRMSLFSVREEMGFEGNQIKSILLKQPAIFTLAPKSFIMRFNYIHLEMKISHQDICLTPEILMCRLKRLKERDGFLKFLNRNQYDSTKPNYVSLKNLITRSDVEFSEQIAQRTIDDFNLYLKSL